MSIHVTDFKWGKGKNDLQYIELLEKTLKNEQRVTALAMAKVRQLAKENKEIRNKTINEFAERLKSDEFQKYNLDMVFETSRDLSYSDCIDAFHEYIDEVSEQLKDGGENE